MGENAGVPLLVVPPDGYCLSTTQGTKSALRRKPRCSKCGEYMEGHKKKTTCPGKGLQSAELENPGVPEDQSVSAMGHFGFEGETLNIPAQTAQMVPTAAAAAMVGLVGSAGSAQFLLIGSRQR